LQSPFAVRRSSPMIGQTENTLFGKVIAATRLTFVVDFLAINGFYWDFCKYAESMSMKIESIVGFANHELCSFAATINKNTMSKGIYTGIIEKDEHGNFFCGEYLLDYQMVLKGFILGDEITIKTVIVNPSDKSYNLYPKKSRNFAIANDKPEY
jgi:hypothetical protein